MSPLRVGGFESRRVLKDAFPLLHLLNQILCAGERGTDFQTLRLIFFKKYA